MLANCENSQEQLSVAAFMNIGTELRELSDAGYAIVLVSSGAITAGVFGDQKSRDDVEAGAEERRYAARGWDIVVQQWKHAIGENRVSSTLLTKRELHNESMRAMLMEVIACCLSHGDIFVVNENDCLSDDEIKFGDNDTLAAAIAVACKSSGLFESVKLLLLTNKNGLNKIASDDSTLIETVTDISSVETFAGSAANKHSRGGMITKIQAAKHATSYDIDTYIANGATPNAIKKTIDRKIGTHFVA